jgi:SAM-dependent methyltransferase
MSSPRISAEDLPLFRQRALQLWNESGLANIKPMSGRFGEFPEGWDAVEELRRILTPFAPSTVLEVGCGYGRLCKAFSPEHYIGVDINAAAIARARELSPGYRFDVVQYSDRYPPADLVLFYTVLLHLADQDAISLIESFGDQPQTRSIVIAEIMVGDLVDHNTANTYAEPDRLHSVFSRTPEFYVDAAHRAGFILYERVAKPYHFYPGIEIQILIFRRRPELPSLIIIPDDLSNPYLEYEGLYDDGWLAPSFSVKVNCPESARNLVIEGMYPAIYGQPQVLQILFQIAGSTPKLLTCTPGDVRLREPVVCGEGVHEFVMTFPSPLILPDPDTRHVGMHLSKIGFE